MLAFPCLFEWRASLVRSAQFFHVELLLLFIFHCIPCIVQGESNNGRLESVFVVHRHSLRAPVYYPPAHPELNGQLYPRGAGYLTRKGIDACFNVGKLQFVTSDDILHIK